MLNNDQRESAKGLDRFNREKLYIQLMRIFLDNINNGRWQLKERIPSEDELCSQYGVSRITVRQAVNNLVSDGYLTKIQGKGTYVASNLPVVGLAMKTGLTERIFGREVTLEREILTRGLRQPAPEIREYLRSASEIFYVLSRRLAEGIAAYIEEAFIPHDMLPYLDELDISQNSLYSYLQERGTKKIFRMSQTIDISPADADAAEALGVEPGTPVLVIHRLFISSDNTPVAYTRIQGRTDRYKFQTEFERIR